MKRAQNTVHVEVWFVDGFEGAANGIRSCAAAISYGRVGTELLGRVSGGELVRATLKYI